MPDLIVIGVQELIELTPGQYISADTNMIKLSWESILIKSINSQPNSNYVVLRSLHLVALGLFVFIRTDGVQNIRNLNTSFIKTGLGGMAANKGGIGISFNYHDTSIAFVTAHFAAGSSAVEERNRDYFTINEGLRFQGKKLYEHDMIFWLGDFNYRLNVPNEEARTRISKNDWKGLASNDQLREQMLDGRVFDGFSEGELSFPPTYKYDNNSNVYDTSEKARTPSWTDRILFKGKHIRQLDYARGEIMMSDHRPVRSIFVVMVNQIDNKKRDAIQKDLLKKLFASGASQKIQLASVAKRPSNEILNRTKSIDLLNIKPDNSIPKQQTGILIQLDDEPGSTNPFLEGPPSTWNYPSGRLPPPSSEYSKWWQENTTLLDL